jgi:hypothetical protein
MWNKELGAEKMRKIKWILNKIERERIKDVKK